jgi:hypothetical protein
MILLNRVILAKGFALDIPVWLRRRLWLGARKMWGLGCCFGSLPSRIREAGINGILPVRQASCRTGPCHLFRFAATRPRRQAPKAAEGYYDLRSGRFCESPIRKSAICYRQQQPVSSIFCRKRCRSSWPKLLPTWGLALDPLLSFNVAEGFTAISSWYLTTWSKR